MVVAVLVALPPLRVTAEPRFVPSTLNCTVPVGVPVDPLDESVTVAVKVTDCPATDGFTDEETEDEVVAWLTVSVPVA